MNKSARDPYPRVGGEPRIHPSAFVAPSADVVGDVTVGEAASIWYQCVIRGDVAPISIGARSNVQDLTMVHADHDLETRIGVEVGIGHRAIIHGCTIEDGALIGMGAIILSGAIVGAGSVVGAGALVAEGMIVPPGTLALGMPARIVRAVDDELRARIAKTIDSYARLKDLHRVGKFKPAAKS